MVTHRTIAWVGALLAITNSAFAEASELVVPNCRIALVRRAALASARLGILHEVSVSEGDTVELAQVVATLRAPDTAFSLVRYGGEALLQPEGGFTENANDIVEAAGSLTVAVPCSADGCRRSFVRN